MNELLNSVIILLSDVLFWPVLIFISLCITDAVFGRE